MPSYTFECRQCGNLEEKIYAIGAVDRPKCCDNAMQRVLKRPPGVVISPKNQAVKDKMKYYGIKNIVTGEGITKDTDVSIPPGISLEDK